MRHVRNVKQPAWRKALLRRGAGAVAKAAHLPLPLVKRVKAGTAKLSPKSERKLYNAHRKIQYARLRHAGADSKLARRESSLRDTVVVDKRILLIKSGANDLNLDAYQNKPMTEVRDLAKRYQEAIRLIQENKRRTTRAKDVPRIKDIASGIRRSGRIWAIEDLERYVEPYRRGQVIATPSSTKRTETLKLVSNTSGYISQYWESLSDLDVQVRDLAEQVRQLDVVASSDDQWDVIRNAAIDLRKAAAARRGQGWTRLRRSDVETHSHASVQREEEEDWTDDGGGESPEE
jgi:hypothetical protein